MEFTSILDCNDIKNRDLPEPSFFIDLNLDQIIGKIQELWGKNIKKMFYYLPADEKTTLYRRDIYTDIKDKKLLQIFTEFIERMDMYEDAIEKEKRARVTIQTKYWHITAAFFYCSAFKKLADDLSGKELSSEGLKGFRDYLNAFLKSPEYTEIASETEAIRNELDGMKLLLAYNGDRFIVSEGTTDDTFEKKLDELFPDRPRTVKNPFSFTESLTSLEIEIYLVLADLKPKLFKRIELFIRKYEEYTDPTLIRFAKEIAFYLSFAGFEAEMNRSGYSFCRPDFNPDKDMCADELYDLALACVNLQENKPVVSNSFSYHKDEKFFVVTGPNQGGKTTFARSLGQLVYFARMGLYVPAAHANLHYFNDILTHFSVEESVETGRGKLKEELIRLAPMMSTNKTNSFVIINELFTTAANYDAGIMGKKVLAHFIELNCIGIYVTHIKELSEGHPGVVSLRAMLDSNNIQNFKITRAPAVDDACANNQINKYKLNYEQIKERLAAKFMQ